MGKLLLMPVLLVVLMFGLLNADEWVSGYYRSNGTWVDGYWRTASDNSLWNNYSTQGNVNPYTGEKGYESPYKLPSLPSLPSFDHLEAPGLPSYGIGSTPGVDIERSLRYAMDRGDYTPRYTPDYTPRTEWVSCYYRSGYYRSNGTWVSGTWVNGYWRTR